MLRKLFLAAAVAALAPSTSQAVFTVQFGTDPVVIDNTGPDLNPSLNAITLVNADSGPFIVSTLSATSAQGPVVSNVVESSTTLTNTGGVTATITIIVTRNDFVDPGEPGDLFLLANVLSVNLVSSTTGTQLAGGGFVSLVGTSIATPAVAITAGTLNNVGLVNPGPAPDPAETSTMYNRTGTPFTLINAVTVTLAPGATVNFQNSTTVTGTPVVPAPAGLVLAATALPFAGLVRRRLRRA